jgi:predicted transcriptional regulator
VTTSDAEPSKSIELAAEIVAAFVANNSLPIAELPALQPYLLKVIEMMDLRPPSAAA